MVKRQTPRAAARKGLASNAGGGGPIVDTVKAPISEPLLAGPGPLAAVSSAGEPSHLAFDLEASTSSLTVPAAAEAVEEANPDPGPGLAADSAPESDLGPDATPLRETAPEEPAQSEEPVQSDEAAPAADPQPAAASHTVADPEPGPEMAAVSAATPDLAVSPEVDPVLPIGAGPEILPAASDIPLIVPVAAPARTNTALPNFEMAAAGATLQTYLLNESIAAVAHWQALSRVGSPAELIRLQVDEMQRAADASLTCMARMAGHLGRPAVPAAM